MKVKEIRLSSISVTELLGYFSLIIYLLATIFVTMSFFARSVPGIVYDSIMYLTLAIIIMRDVMLRTFRYNELIGLLITLFFVCVIARVSYVVNPVTIGFALIYSLRNLSFKNLARITFMVSSFCFIVIVLSSLIGIIPNYLEVSGNRIRYYLGFRYSLYPSTLLLNIIALSSFLWVTRKKYLPFVFLFIINYYIYSQTNSRLTFLSSSLILLVDMLLVWKPKFLESIKWLLYFFSPSYIYALFLSFLTVRIFNPFSNFWHFLDSFLGRRITLSISSLQQYGISILGQKVQWVGNGLDIQGNRSSGTYLFVDNMYINVTQQYGIVLIILLVLIMTIVIFKLLTSKNYLLVFLLILISYHALIDNLVLGLHYNFFWILIGKVLFSKVENLDRLENNNYD